MSDPHARYTHAARSSRGGLRRTFSRPNGNSCRRRAARQHHTMDMPSISGISGLSLLLGPEEGDLDKVIALVAEKPAPSLSSPRSLARIFDDAGQVEREEVVVEYAPYVPPALIGGLTAQDIINLAMKRASGEWLVMHVMPDRVKSISIPNAKGKTLVDIRATLYAAMSDGTSNAFNIKLATFEDGIGGLITIAASTNDEAIFRTCVIGLGLHKVDEATYYFHTSFTALKKVHSWMDVENERNDDLTKAIDLLLVMQTFKDDVNAGSFDGKLGDAIISLPVCPDMHSGSIFNMLLKTATEAAKEIDRPVVRSQIQARIKDVINAFAA